jgi:hypothetical protein
MGRYRLVGSLSTGAGKKITDDGLPRSGKVSNREREILYETSDNGESRWH